MAQIHFLMGAESLRARPVVRTIGLADLRDALRRGLADFSAMPTHAVFLCLIYPIVGLVLARAMLWATTSCRCCFRSPPASRSSARSRPSASTS